MESELEKMISQTQTNSRFYIGRETFHIHLDEKKNEFKMASPLLSSV